MRTLTLFRLEYNVYNGFIFKILEFENGYFEGALLGVNFNKSFLHIDFLFFLLEVKSPIL